MPSRAAAPLVPVASGFLGSRGSPTRHEYDAAGAGALIGVEELADYLGVPVQTIYDWRLSGRAPRAFKLGKHLRFAVSDVQEWLEEHHEGRGDE